MDALPDQRLIRVPVQLRLPLPDHPQFRLVRLQPPLLVRAAVRTQRPSQFEFNMPKT